MVSEKKRAYRRTENSSPISIHFALYESRDGVLEVAYRLFPHPSLLPTYDHLVCYDD